MKGYRRRAILALFVLFVAVLVALAWQGTHDASQQRQKRLNNALILESERDDSVAVSKLIHEGADPNACEQPSSFKERLERDYPKAYSVLHYFDRDDNGPRIYDPALVNAVSLGNVNAVKALLAGGASVQQKDSTGESVLHLAKEEARDSYRRPGVSNNSDKILLMLKQAAKNPANNRQCACQ
jgi:ankyrin repeat protein